MPDMDLYSTAKPLLGALPQWIADEQERRRLGTYMLYEQIYWGVPDTFKLVSRGTEDKPIYIPAGRSIVETMHRYVANAMTLAVSPELGTPNEQALAKQVMDDLAARERLYSKFSSNKRYGLIRGDWMFHLYAEPDRLPGAKISIFALDPATVFPIYNMENIDEVIGYHIAEMYRDDDGKDYIRRLTYRKNTGTGGPSPIDVTDELYELDSWGGPGMDVEAPKIVRALRPPFQLPSPIDQLPIYHIQNFTEPGTIWGSSEMRGLERILAAINQSISDEELALALEGLGMYATDAGSPVNDDGEEVGWNLGPGRVVELPGGKKMERVTGVSSVTPYQEHLKYLHEQINEVMGMSAVAKGRVDVQVAESGIALYLELAPLLARSLEKEQIVTDVMRNMTYDLSKWYVAYEGGAFNGLLNTRWIPTYGDKVPINRKETFEELLALFKEKVVSGQYVRGRLRTMGYTDLPDDTTMVGQILEEIQMVGQIEADITGARVDAEVADELNAVEAPEA